MSWTTAITNVGLALINESIANGDLVFTKALASEGTFAFEDLKTATALVGTTHDMGIVQLSDCDECKKITARISSSTNDYTMTQIGLYAKLSGSTNPDTLIMVAQNTDGEQIPSAEDMPEFIMEFNFIIPLTTASNTTIVVDPQLFTTRSDVLDILNENYARNNLLDNPDFKINQRGSTVYTATASSSVISKNCVDRWFIYMSAGLTGNATATPMVNGISINNQSSGQVGFIQKIRGFKSLFEKEIVLSICVDDITYSTQITPKDVSGGYGSFTMPFGLMRIYVHAGTDMTVDIFINIGLTVTINWVKLETGTIPTQFISPDFMVELIKIQSMNDDGSQTIVSSDTLPTIINSQMVSNPNLLDNPDFKINQRGLTSYTGVTNLTIYTADRWFLLTTDSTVSLTNEGITLTGYTRQRIKNFKSLIGKTVTLSITGSNLIFGLYVQSNNVNTLLGARIANTGSVTIDLSQYTEYISNATQMFVHLASTSTSADMPTEVKWAKLEIGPVATSFIPPNPEEELVKIQSMDNDGNLKIVANANLPTIMNSQMVSNPNLLDNPDFKINQRGLTSYTGTTLYTYTVDRWCIWKYNCDTYGVVTPLTDGGIIVDGANGIADAILTQIIENGADLVGKTVTLTVDVAEITGTINICQQWNTVKSSGISTTGIHSVTFEWQTATKYMVIITNTNCTHYKLNSMKLEIGSVATSFVTPNPSLELIKCQRYYQIIAQNRAFAVTNTVSAYGKVIECNIPINFPMRNDINKTTIISGNLNDLNGIFVGYMDNGGNVGGCTIYRTLLNQCGSLLSVAITLPEYATLSDQYVLVVHSQLAVSADLS